MIPRIDTINIPASSLPDYFDQAVNAGVPALMTHKGTWAEILSANDLAEVEVTLRNPEYQRETDIKISPASIVTVAVYHEVEVLRCT
jgi:hypothetical protein